MSSVTNLGGTVGIRTRYVVRSLHHLECDVLSEALKGNEMKTQILFQVMAPALLLYRKRSRSLLI